MRVLKDLTEVVHPFFAGFVASELQHALHDQGASTGFREVTFDCLPKNVLGVIVFGA